MSKDIKFQFDNPEENEGYLLWQVTMLWQRKMKRELDKINITHTQFVLLATIAWISKSMDLVTQIDIANHSNTDRMMVSKVLRTLENKKIIARNEHHTDTRAKTITLTDKGITLLKKALKIVNEVDSDFFSIITNKEISFDSLMIELINGNKKVI